MNNLSAQIGALELGHVVASVDDAALEAAQASTRVDGALETAGHMLLNPTMKVNNSRCF